MAPPYSNGLGYPAATGGDAPASDELGPLFVNVVRLLCRYSLRAVLGAAGSAASVLLTGVRASTLQREARRRARARARGGKEGAFRPPPAALVLAETLLRLLRHNLAPQRVFSVPHVLVAVWVLVLLWGERGTYQARVARCHWDHWERWPPGATPHHLVLVADPQLVDAHTYPGRPWPLSALTVTLTDNYMRRSFGALQDQLRPDTVLFLGDLFDGGREWRPAHGDGSGNGGFEDPAWSERPAGERPYAQAWHKTHGEAYWQREYARFGDIFLDAWPRGGTDAGPGQRGRRVLASLPGNHDLGFGAEVRVAVRQRFEAFFGESNRVDVLGNHTFVSVDTVSLSAASSDRAADVEPIYRPADAFLRRVAWEKKKAVARELRFLRGAREEGFAYPHRVEDLAAARFDTDALRRALARVGDGNGDGDGEGDGGSEEPADLPTVLLSHVPLYRPPGTPCGPLREHWPPAADRDGHGHGDDAPAEPDHRNAIAVLRGYQYQNVLSEADSVRLVHDVGNVVHAFSGDDHDYCAVVHDAQQRHVPEITVKAFSMAMGVPTPGFLMVSLYNPINTTTGRPLAVAGAANDGAAASSSSTLPTMQTHLCLLPNQIATYARYAGMVVVSVVLLAIYAVLVHVLGLPVFAFDPLGDGSPPPAGPAPSWPAAAAAAAPSPHGLPLFGKAKVEDDEYGRDGGAGASDASGFVSFRGAVPATYARGRVAGGGGASGLPASLPSPARGPKIQIARDEDEEEEGEDEDEEEGDDDDDDDDDSVDGAGNGSAGSVLAEDYLASGSRWRPASSYRAVGSGGGGLLGAVLGAALAGMGRLFFGAVSGWRSVGGLFGGGGGGGSRRRRPLRRRQRFGNSVGGVGGGGVGSGRRGGAGWASFFRRTTSVARRRRGLGGGFGLGSGWSSQRLLRLAAWDFYFMAFRVAWMVVACWGWLNYRG